MQLFLNCLLNLQSSSILSEIDTERLFCNIPEIYTANRIFWHENINAVVKASRESGNPLDPDMMLNGFVKVGREGVRKMEIVSWCTTRASHFSKGMCQHK